MRSMLDNRQFLKIDGMAGGGPAAAPPQRRRGDPTALQDQGAPRGERAAGWAGAGIGRLADRSTGTDTVAFDRPGRRKQQAGIGMARRGDQLGGRATLADRP